MYRLGGAVKAAARCWVGVPNDVMRLLVGQDLANFRLATCLFLILTADLIDTVANHESVREGSINV